MNWQICIDKKPTKLDRQRDALSKCGIHFYDGDPLEQMSIHCYGATGGGVWRDDREGDGPYYENDYSAGSNGDGFGAGFDEDGDLRCDGDGTSPDEWYE